ncbi:borealin-2-like isoform X1 [Eleutherodactylus coqui]|uniref:borealin-2-like isoform X1 n=1 Tax=Eleutherodactylus coqui TaxID=57060 RepID=UPI003462232D
MMEVKKELEALARLPDQILEVELLKMPMSVRQMKVGEYYKLMEMNKAEPAPLVKVRGLLIFTVLCPPGVPFMYCTGFLLQADSLDEELREAGLVKNSKKGKATASVESHRSAGSKGMSTTQKNRTVQKVPKSKSLISLTKDTGKTSTSLPRSISVTPLGKAPKKMTSMSTWNTGSRPSRNMTGPVTRSTRNRTASSLSDDPLNEGLPFVHIPLVDGQTLSSAYDDLESLNVQLLRQDTVQHIHTLVGQLTNLCAKASSTQNLAGSNGST